MLFHRYCYLLITLSVFSLCESQYNISDILPSDYTKDDPPIVDGKPVTVTVNITVQSLTLTSDNQMETLFIDFWIRQYWSDYRLLSPFSENGTTKLILNSQWMDYLWVPDSYFYNAISGAVPDILFPSLYFMVTNRTEVLMVARVQMQFHCEMDFHKFPFDTQLCNIHIVTLSLTNDKLLFEWMDFAFSQTVLPDFTITSVWFMNSVDVFPLGDYSCLYAYFQLTRNMGNYMVKRYVPSFIIVLMTFLGFWIPTSVHPARVILIATSIVALITQQIQQELDVSYVYALEMWTMICIIFVFATLVEYVIAIVWQVDEESPAQHCLTQNAVIGHNSDSLLKKLAISFKVKPGPRNCSVDMVARFLFPIAFAVTILVYSLVYYYL